MKYHARFFHNAVTDPKRLTHACGSDSLFIIDGRLSATSRTLQVEEACRKRGFKGYQIYQSEILEQNPITPIVRTEE